MHSLCDELDTDVHYLDETEQDNIINNVLRELIPENFSLFMG
jgi:hypothetical protein